MIILGKESSRKIQAREKAPKVGKKAKKAENKFSAFSIFSILSSHSSYQPLQQRIVARLEKKLQIVTNINAPIVEVITISASNSG
jgi:hypothetical protein